MQEAKGTFRYTLEPYKGPNSRHTCPACGAAHKFVRYIDTATGAYIADEVGRCDREESCGYHLKPAEYFKAHPDRAGEYKPAKRKRKPVCVEDYTPLPAPELYTIPQKAVEALFINEAKVEASRLPSAQRWPASRALWGKEKADLRARIIAGSAFRSSPGASALAAFLADLLGPDAYQGAAARYHLGSWRGAAVFWYIDKAGRIRAGKCMYYRPDGHRDKDYNPFYMHGVLASQGMLPEGWKLRRCLFGEHLLAADPAAPVALVESEKTALIASALVPGALWLGAGGLHYLNAESCAGLKGRQVVAYPDLGAFDKWQDKLPAIAARVGFRVRLSDYLEQRATPEDRAAGLDIADYLAANNQLDSRIR